MELLEKCTAKKIQWKIGEFEGREQSIRTWAVHVHTVGAQLGDKMDRFYIHQK